MGVMPSSTLPQPSKKRAYVRAMFDRIAPRYDLLNRLMTLGLDRGWRRSALTAISVGPGDRVIDLGAGTGDFAELCRARGAEAIGVDLALGMLRAARDRDAQLPLVQCDGEELPFRDGWASAVTCGFALRNFSDLDRILAECARVLRPHGRLAILEIDEPRLALLRWGHRAHFRRVIPWLGRWLSDAEAYRYLPESLAYLPAEDELRSRLARAGFSAVRKRVHLLGAVQSVTAART